MINGKRYDWEDITVVLPTGIAVYITDISYSDSQAATARYGKGGIPKGYGRGNYEASGSMTIDLEEWEKLKLALLPSIYDHIPFNITVSYAETMVPVVTDILPQVKITKVDTSNSQGSENAGAKTIEFAILKPIKYNFIPAKL